MSFATLISGLLIVSLSMLVLGWILDHLPRSGDPGASEDRPRDRDRRRTVRAGLSRPVIAAPSTKG